MHRPRSHRIAAALRVGSLLFLLGALLLTISVFGLAYAFLGGRRELLLAAYSALTFGLLILLAYRVAAGSARCSLCSQPVLLARTCQKSRNARSLWGSYRFRVARDIATRGTFQCPYCGEHTLCLPRERRH